MALVLVASIRIIATYTVFSHTYDEPAHIACGMEWLDKGVYKWEPQHPPLARVATALGPYLLGTRCQNTPNVDLASMTHEGLAILYYGHHYDLTLALARLGILPFFWIACLVVYWWGRRYFSPSVAVVAVFLFSFLPPVLAHAGLATTDMALTAFLGAAFLSGSDLGGASHPGSRRAVRRKHRPGHAFEVFHAGVLSRRRGFGAGLVFRHRAAQAGLAARAPRGKGYRRLAWRCWWLAC